MSEGNCVREIETPSQARERAVQLLMAIDLNMPENVSSFILEFWKTVATIEDALSAPKKAVTYASEEKKAARIAKMYDFANARINGVLEHLNEIDEIISSFLDNWDIMRLGSIERAVLRLGVWELKYSDVPKQVVINEAIDLVNWFSSKKSKPIVNAVLDSFAKTLA